MNNVLIHRDMEDAILRALDAFEVVTIMGPRQSGKTTLCRKMFPQLPYLNFEDLSTLQRAKEDINGFLVELKEGAVMDEVQNFPEMLSALQVLVDEDRFAGNAKRKFVLTGSCNFSLLSRVTQSMAGRTALFTLLPFSLRELGSERRSLPTDSLILRGGYPAVWLRPDVRRMLMDSYYSTYVERDVRQVMNIKDFLLFYKFMRLCAGRIGTEFNASALSNEVGVSLPTINSWLSVLAASYIIYLLPPYASNIKKRLVKTPKLYFYDTCLACFLLDIDNESTLRVHPLRGALFENMVMNEMMKADLNRGNRPDLYFYRDQSQREVDVVRLEGNRVSLYEIKSSMTYHPDFFKNLKYVSKLIPVDVKTMGVIYDGDTHESEGLWNFREFVL